MVERTEENSLLYKELYSSLPVVSWDLDEVLAYTQEAVIDRLNQLTGLTRFYKPPITKWWQITDWLVENEGWNQTSARRYEASLWTDPDILGSADPFPGRQAFSLTLSSFDISQYVVTGRNPNLKEATLGWCYYFYPWIGVNNVHIREDESISAPQFKVETIRNIGANIHFEDSAVDAQAVLEGTDAFVVSLFHQSDQGLITNPRFIDFTELSIWFHKLQTHQLGEVYGQNYDKKIARILELAAEQGL
jgi:5'(3')-deoxyribonucleotidase